MGLDNFTQNFITDNYVGKQETEVDVDGLVHGVELNELLPGDCSSCFVSSPFRVWLLRLLLS